MRRVAVHARLNLAHHRVVARALRADPTLIDEARAVVDAWSRDNSSPPAYVEEWRRLVYSSVETVCEKIVHQAAESERLRGCSPFALIPSRLLTREQVHRLWRMAAFHATRTLHPSEYHDYAEHLKKLDRKDRIRRFCRAVDDKWIDRLVRDFQKDQLSVVIGHYNLDLVLDGGICVSLVDRGGERFAESGVSVLPEARHREIGYHLLERGLLWARNHDATRFYSLCATNNWDMINLARHHQMDVSVVEDGVEGVIVINPLTRGSVSLEILEDQIGEWDYHDKAHDTAFSFVLGNEFEGEAQETDLRRLVKLAVLGGTDVIATYVVVFRYALIESGASAEDHTSFLAGVRANLEPLVGHDPSLGTYVRGLPSVLEKRRVRYGVWRPVLARRAAALRNMGSLRSLNGVGAADTSRRIVRIRELVGRER